MSTLTKHLRFFHIKKSENVVDVVVAVAVADWEAEETLLLKVGSDSLGIAVRRSE